MRKILIIVRKEFKQVFRNKGMLPIIFVMPIVQLLILSNAATFEVKNIKLAIVDHDHSPYSREIMRKFQASDYFELVPVNDSPKLAHQQMEKGEVDLILEIPIHFQSGLYREQKASLSLIVDAIDGAKASVEMVYANFIIRDFSEKIGIDFITGSTNARIKSIDISQLFWFNPELNYITFMVPGILVLLVTMVAIFLSGMNIVREKEIGTLEQINVTPIKKYHFILGKLLPFWLLGLFELGLGLILAAVIFHIPMIGNLFLVFLFAAIYLLVILGIGLFISNFTDTQQQAMFLSWFFLVIFILMSGLFTPIESMPDWAQQITAFNPIRYFVEVMRMVLLKGASFQDIADQLIKITIYALIINALATVSYKKTH